MDSSNGRLKGDGGVCVRAPTEQTQHPASSLSLTSIPLDCAGQKKALLIGIRTSRTGGYPELKGAHDDVYKMRKLLLDVYNYTPTEINILMDDGHHVEPTRDNILAAIAKLVKDVKDGDHLLFHYSGHSTQVENPRSKSEEDGKDECLIPLDGEEMKIIDNELHASLVAPLPAGAHLVAVLDTCHSGSLLDLKHYRCNRVPVPWLYRGRRNSEEPRNRVVRQGARLLTLSQTGGPAHQAHNARSTPSKRRSIISVMCDPPASSTPSSRSSTYTSTGLTRAGTGSGPAKGPLARLRNASASARARAASLSLSLSIPAPAQDKENLTADAVGPVLPAFSKLTWILPDEEAHCESPVGQFPCNGWCRNMEGHSTCVAPDSDDEVKADVVSLASCKDSQIAWEADGVSMTSSLVDLLRENPHRSLKDVLISISHATHSLALVRHGRSQAHKRNRKDYTARLARTIARLENRSTVSLNVPSSPVADTPPNARLAPRPTFPNAFPAAKTQDKKGGFVQRVGKQLASLKQKLLDVGKDRGYDMDMFQNPELASPRPLDMNRPWRM
ncbi:caspase domain-containing protein [Mycena leptocephala]|nr:caspase domain-containing protein [Mycena leptocephala]